MNDKISESIVLITGIVFLGQIPAEILLERKQGFEYTIHACAGLFILSCIYCVLLKYIKPKGDS